MKYLLDSDTCIGVLRGSLRAKARMQTVQPNDCGVSTVTVFELLSGVERCRNPKQERQKVWTFLAPLHVLPFDFDAAQQAAKVRWHLEKAGQPSDPYDLQLVAQALTLDVTIITGNTNEFSRVPGLVWENWMV